MNNPLGLLLWLFYAFMFGSIVVGIGALIAMVVHTSPWWVILAYTVMGMAAVYLWFIEEKK